MFLRVVVFIILILLLYRLIKSIRQNIISRQKASSFISERALGEDLVEDPACHTYIPVSQAYTGEISGRTYYFCSKKCYEKYILGK
ncbi:MAG TPA: YHS domain-containing protein [Deltaproteobacteria bacterium]|nr:YHS domain-containing protein [Deltaproteobacteria bacterium]